MVSRILMPFLAAALLADAAPRAWKSADASRSVDGEFVSRGTADVTIRRSSDRKQVTIPLDRLHPDDRNWLNARHPLPGSEAPPPSGVFDQLAFGDNRAEVLEKLKASEIVEMPLKETFLGRVGMNGVFHTRKKIGGLEAVLYFDWDDAGGLKEITLHTTPLPASALHDRLVPCWKELTGLLTTLHGNPVNAKPELDIAPLEDGAMIATHLWKLEKSHSAMLGASRVGDRYQVAVRFTTEDIQPVIIPAGTAPGNADVPVGR